MNALERKIMAFLLNQRISNPNILNGFLKCIKKHSFQSFLNQKIIGSLRSAYYSGSLFISDENQRSEYFLMDAIDSGIKKFIIDIEKGYKEKDFENREHGSFYNWLLGGLL